MCNRTLRADQWNKFLQVHALVQHGAHTHIHSHALCLPICPRLFMRENVPGRQRAFLSKQLQQQQPDMGVRVGSHNTSVTSKLLWKNLQKSRFFTPLIQRGKLLAQLPHNSLFCHVVLHNISWLCFTGSSLVKCCLKMSRSWAGKKAKESQRWQIWAPHGGWWVLFTVVWLTLLRGYKLLLEKSWIPTQACGIQPGTRTVSGFDTAVWLTTASQTGA